MKRWLSRFRRYRLPEPESRDDLIARLVREGFLERDGDALVATAKTLELVGVIDDDYIYWTSGCDARRALAIAEGRDPVRAAIGGTFYVDEEFDASGGSLRALLDCAGRQDELRAAAEQGERP